MQVSSALPLLDSVLDDPVLLTRTIPYFRVAAEGYRLASLCACVPPSRGTNVLEMAGLAAFHAACVNTWLVADKPGVYGGDGRRGGVVGSLRPGWVVSRLAGWRASQAVLHSGGPLEVFRFS